MTERKTKDAERKSNVGKVCVVKMNASQCSAKQGANAAELGLYYNRLGTRKQEKKPFFSVVKKEKRNEEQQETARQRASGGKKRQSVVSNFRTKIERNLKTTPSLEFAKNESLTDVVSERR
ncbi:MAG: hypothetical protein IJE97_01080 [Thermoguttaceae bacterium]|nr:hypothetical protein [Thermoguttaceae bacterium]MBQ6826560.1 hypothetical protein [Thermoguttaceae bacterium]